VHHILVRVSFAPKLNQASLIALLFGCQEPGSNIPGFFSSTSKVFRKSLAGLPKNLGTQICSTAMRCSVTITVISRIAVAEFGVTAMS